MKPLYSNEELLSLLKNHYSETGSIPKLKDIPEGCTIKRRFGTWNSALKLAGIPVRREGGYNGYVRKTSTSCTVCGKSLKGTKCRKFCLDCGPKYWALYHNHDQRNNAVLKKIALLDMLGGKCPCGYDKNYASMHFHHLRDKSFNLTIVNIRDKSMDELIVEANKCVIKCSNCHGEEHNPSLDRETWCRQLDSNQQLPV